MTMTAAINRELADTACSVAECLETAHLMGRATLQIDPTIGAPPDYEVITLGVPLCTNHAHLFRGVCDLTEFNNWV